MLSAQHFPLGIFLSIFALREPLLMHNAEVSCCWRTQKTSPNVLLSQTGGLDPSTIQACRNFPCLVTHWHDPGRIVSPCKCADANCVLENFPFIIQAYSSGSIVILEALVDY